jgi:hypothetical protein
VRGAGFEVRDSTLEMSDWSQEHEPNTISGNGEYAFRAEGGKLDLRGGAIWEDDVLTSEANRLVISGHQSGIDARRGSRVTMERVDVQNNDKRGIIISENSVLGIWSGGATITGNGLNTPDDWDGYGPGLEIKSNSTASVDRLTVSGNGRGVSVNRGSIFSGGWDGDASNDDYAIVIKDNKQRGLEVRKNSNIDLKNIEISGNGATAYVNDDNSNFYEEAVSIRDSSTGDMRDGKIVNNRGRALDLRNNSKFNLRTMTISGNGYVAGEQEEYDAIRVGTHSHIDLNDVAVTQGGSSRPGLYLDEHSIAHINDSETSSTLGKVNVDEESEVQISEDAQATLSEVSLNRGAHLQFYGSTPTSTVDSVTCWNQTTTSGQSIARPNVIFFDNGDNSTVSSIGSDCGVVQ